VDSVGVSGPQARQLPPTLRSPRLPHWQINPSSCVGVRGVERQPVTIWKAPIIILSFAGMSASSVDAAATTLTACGTHPGSRRVNRVSHPFEPTSRRTVPRDKKHASRREGHACG